jgi:hypothetical protein
LSETNNPTPERRRYRRWRDDSPAAGGNNAPPAPPTQLDLEALRGIRNADGLNQPITPDNYDGINEPEEPSLIGNPYMLAGIAVAVAIVLAVLVVVVFGSSDSSAGSNGNNNGGDGPNSSIFVDPLTPQPSVTGGGGGLSTKSIAAATVRTGPGQDFSEISPLRSGQDVTVIGKNADASWFQIDLGASLRGWVPASALRVTDDNAKLLPIVGNTPIPQPTVLPPTERPAAPTATPTPQVTVTPTPTPQGGPDLTLSFQAACTPGGAIVLLVKNSGGATLTGRSASVTLSNSQGVIFNGNVALPELAPGASASVSTGQSATAPKMTASVQLFGTPVDSNPGNNSAECAVAGPPLPPLVSPTGASGGLITPTPRPGNPLPTPTGPR